MIVRVFDYHSMIERYLYMYLDSNDTKSDIHFVIKGHKQDKQVLGCWVL
jgi:hypothetical protein